VVFNLNETFKFKAKHFIHLIPFFISLIDNLDTFFLTAEQVAQSTKIIAENYKNYGNFSGILFPVKYNYVLRMALYITYLLFSWRYYLNYVNNQKTENEKRIVRWLKYFLMVFGIFILSTAFSLFYNFKYLIEKNYNEITLFPFIFVGFAVIILCAFIFFNPILLYGIPRIQNLNTHSLQTEKKQISSINKLNTDSPAIDKTANNEESIELNEDAVKELQLAKSIIREIKELQLYKDTQFSLVKASIHFNVPVHHISFVLNNQIKKSFPDVISKMRVEHAIALIENSKNKKYTLEAIGNMSGFRSRTTFYVSFKKITGVSPLEYSNLSNNESKNNEL
jgi:AraC-like DNA-binding protein